MSDYDLFARLYDLEHRDYVDDVELYRNYAARCHGPVLELGCGAGRVSLALSQTGFDVVGVDDSAAMLSLARDHAIDAGLSERIRFERMDVRSLELTDRFALAAYPLNGFIHLLTVKDQMSALRGVHRVLLPGGFLVIDLPNPHTVFTADADGQLYLRSRFTSLKGNTILCMTSAQTDLASQVQRLTLVYDEVGRGGQVQRTTVETELRFVYRYEMEHLLCRAGFEVDAVCGTYDLDPYESDSPIMLFVAHT